MALVEIERPLPLRDVTPDATGEDRLTLFGYT
jgi:hypothetical protein